MRNMSAFKTPRTRPSLRGRKRRTAVRMGALGSALCSWFLFLACGGRSGTDAFEVDGAIGGSPAGGSAGHVGAGGSGGTAATGGGSAIGGQPAGDTGGSGGFVGFPSGGFVGFPSGGFVGFPSGGFVGFPSGGFVGFPSGGAPAGGFGGGGPMPVQCLTCAVNQCPAASQCFGNAVCVRGTVCTLSTCNSNQGFDFMCVLGCFGGDIKAATQAFSAVACISQSCPGPCIGN